MNYVRPSLTLCEKRNCKKKHSALLKILGEKDVGNSFLTVKIYIKTVEKQDIACVTAFGIYLQDMPQQAILAPSDESSALKKFEKTIYSLCYGIRYLPTTNPPTESSGLSLLSFNKVDKLLKFGTS